MLLHLLLALLLHLLLALLLHLLLALLPRLLLALLLELLLTLHIAAWRFLYRRVGTLLAALLALITLLALHFQLRLWLNLALELAPAPLFKGVLVGAFRTWVRHRCRHRRGRRLARPPHARHHIDRPRRLLLAALVTRVAAVALLRLVAAFEAALAALFAVVTALLGLQRRRRRRHRRVAQRQRRHHGARVGADHDRGALGELRMRRHGQAVAAVFAPLGIDLLLGVLVEPAQQARRMSVVRHIAFARGQRVPTLRRGVVARTEAQAPVAAADPAHQRRRPCRTAAVAARGPAPALVEHDPAAVVRRRITPRGVVDPGPAPWRDIGPAAVAVGRPARRHRTRHPDRAVFAVVAPHAVLVELFVAGHFAVDVTGRGDALVAAVAQQGPVVEAAVGGQRGAQAALAQLGAAPGAHGQAVAVAVDLGQALEHTDHGDVLVATGVDADAARLAHDHAPVRGRQLEAGEHLGIADAHAGAAVVQVQAQAVVAHFGDLERGFGVEPHRGRADPELGARAAPGRDLVARGQRPVDARRVGFVAVAVGGQRDVALGERDAPDQRRQVLLAALVLGGRERRQQ